MKFDLRQHIRAILTDTTEENLDTLANLIFERTPKAATSEAYRQALTETVRRELATVPRKDSRPDQLAADTQRDTIEPGQSTVTGEDQTRIAAQSAGVLPGGGNVRNSRVALFRKHRVRLSLWLGNKTYRDIERCTIADLEFAAAESDRQSEANATTARKYRKLVKVMQQHHVEVVADLSDEQVEEVLCDE